MAWDSSYTSSLANQYQGMAMQQMAYSNQIGQMGSPYGTGQGGDRMMGGMMNRAGAMGGPMMGAGMGMLGIDPLSLGMRAGMGAWGSGMGAMGAMGVGMGVGIPAMAGMAAVGHMGNQMFTGAQQQQSLNNSLRSSFSFQNQSGGRGFNSSDMGQIGGQIRDMTHQFGPGGEIASFRELSALTAKMGQMGLAQGVKDVQEFGRRFKETVTALKTMAKDLGTTLEGAMEFAGAARGSGIFGMKGAQSFAAHARSASISGGLAMSEVTGMASIGSQISRSIGGLGRSGAVGGVRTINQIGSAMQLGALSEEDIYNATGLSGAEGKQAFATSSMQHTGSFLKSGKGRRLLASLADKDGKLDQGAVDQLMNGDMSIEETVSRGNAMKRNVGRANFIRNEGHLRGAALGQLGGFGAAIQLKQWASSKGIDINNMDDKSMLFAQRHLNMGRDELDATIKMVNSQGAIADHNRVSAENDTHINEMAQRAQMSGISGVSKRFDQAREAVNGKFQKIGQDFFTSGSQELESFINKLTGTYVETMSAKADAAYRNAMLGKRFEGDFKALTGSADRLGGGSILRASGGATAAGFNSGYNDKMLSGGAIASGGAGALLHAGGQYVMHGESGASRYAKAGFNIDAGIGDAALSQRLKNIQVATAAANEIPSSDLVALGTKNAPWLERIYSTTMKDKVGEQRTQSFGAALQKQAASGDVNAKALHDRWLAAGSEAERVRIMSAGEQAIDLDGSVRTSATYGVAGTALGSGGTFNSVADKNRAYAGTLGIGTSSREEQFGRLGALAVGGIAGLIGERNAQGGASGGRMTNLLAGVFGKGQITQEAGAYASSEENQMLTSRLFSSDKTIAANAASETQRLMHTAKGGQLEVLKRNMAVSRFMANPEQADAIAEEYGIAGGAAGLREAQKGLANISATNGSEFLRSEARLRKSVGKGQVDKISRGGLATFDGDKVTLSAATKTALESVPGGEALLASAFESDAISAGLDPESKSAGGRLLLAMGKAQAFQEGLEGLSVADQRKLGRAAAGTAAGAAAHRHAGVQDKMGKDIKRRGGGVLTGAMGALGLEMSRDELNEWGLSGGIKTAEDVKHAESLIRERMHLKAGSAASEGVHTMLEEMRSGKKGSLGKAATLAQGIVGSADAIAGREQDRLKKAEEQDPFGADIAKAAKETNKLLTAIVKASTGAQKALEDAAAKEKNDTEAGQPGQPATPPGK